MAMTTAAMPHLPPLYRRRDELEDGRRMGVEKHVDAQPLYSSSFFMSLSLRKSNAMNRRPLFGTTFMAFAVNPR